MPILAYAYVVFITEQIHLQWEKVTNIKGLLVPFTTVSTIRLTLVSKWEIGIDRDVCLVQVLLPVEQGSRRTDESLSLNTFKSKKDTFVKNWLK